MNGQNMLLAFLHMNGGSVERDALDKALMGMQKEGLVDADFKVQPPRTIADGYNYDWKLTKKGKELVTNIVEKGRAKHDREAEKRLKPSDVRA
jgi:hypothetical protein